MAERLGNGANGRVASELRGRCVRPRLEKDIYFESLVPRFHPISFSNDRHDFLTWPISFHTGQLSVSNDYRFVRKNETAQREQETNLGETLRVYTWDMRLEIWEERNGESESSSHRDESGSFSSGKNSGSNRDACLAEDTVRYRDRWLGTKQTWRGLEEQDENIKRYFILVYSTAIRKISRHTMVRFEMRE